MISTKQYLSIQIDDIECAQIAYKPQITHKRHRVTPVQPSTIRTPSAIFPFALSLGINTCARPLDFVVSFWPKHWTRKESDQAALDVVVVARDELFHEALEAQQIAVVHQQLLRNHVGREVEGRDQVPAGQTAALVIRHAAPEGGRHRDLLAERFDSAGGLPLCWA